MIVQVHYPLVSGRMVLRTEEDWEKNLEAVDAGLSRFDFEVSAESPFFYFKPVIMEDGKEPRWAAGENYLGLSSKSKPREVYPYFEPDQRCSACDLRGLASAFGRFDYRVFYPPGYHENVLKRYPVLYMQDGQNLFFPEEAFQGRHWRIAETLGLLDAMSLVDKVLVVGIYPNAREENYTQPGYERYGRFLVEALKPEIDRAFRTLPGPETTAVCLSSTFGFRDDLKERVASEPRRDLRLYLDSGWPKDNYEATQNMRALLLRRGYREGEDLFYLGFPEALHNEAHWAMRANVPFQFFFGRAGA